MPSTPQLLPHLVLVVAVAIGCNSATAVDPPKPADLLTVYKELGLPLPPAKAKLVRYEAGGGATFNAKPQPTKYSLAFELQPGTKEEGPLLLQGTDEWRPWGVSKTVEVKPEATAADDIDIGYSDAALGLAIQCQDRGWDALAQVLLERSRPWKDKATPAERLVPMAWGYWVGRLTHPTADRTPIAKRMKELMKRDPTLDTERHRLLLKSLELALVPGKGKPGSVEALIDALVDYHSDTGGLEPFQPGDAFWRIAEKGFDAVPALIAALDDDRLTRSTMRGFNNFRSWEMRVGDVVGDLLDGLAGEELDRGADGKSVGGGWLRRQQGWRVTPEAAKAWWAKAEKVGEEEHLFDHVLPSAAEGYTPEPRLVPLRLIATKYPKRLSELYRMVLDKRQDVQSWPLAEVVAKSSLPAKDKIALFELAGKHKSLAHRLPALRELKGLDAKRFDTLLLATVESLPKDVDEPYYRCREIEVARLVVQSDDPKVWAALEAAIKRASLGLRLELLSELINRDEPRCWAERLRLLVAHLDDTEMRDENDDKRLHGSLVGFPYDEMRIMAGNAVAMDISRMLRVEVPYKPDRTADEWAEIREKVRKAAKAELDKAK